MTTPASECTNTTDAEIADALATMGMVRVADGAPGCLITLYFGRRSVTVRAVFVATPHDSDD
jgi:hypothetical protein